MSIDPKDLSKDVKCIEEQYIPIDGYLIVSNYCFSSYAGQIFVYILTVVHMNFT